MEPDTRLFRATLEGAALVALTALLVPTSADPDLWGHVRFGLDILSVRDLPTVDPYSFTSDRPWINHEWLAEVLMGLSYLLAGPAGLAVLKIALLSAIGGVVAWTIWREPLAPVSRLLLFAFVLVGLASQLQTLRPQLWSLLLLAGVLLVFRQDARGLSPALAILPFLLIAWVNFHGGWIVGVGVIALWLLWRLVQRPTERGWTSIVGGLCVVALVVSPYGLRLWRFIWETVGLSRSDIAEWQPITSSLTDLALWGFATVVALLGIGRGAYRDIGPLVITSGLAVASFQVQRLVPFFVLTVSILLGPWALRTNTRSMVTLAATDRMVAFLMAGLIATGAGVFTVWQTRRALTCIPIEDTWGPDLRAAAAIRNLGLRGRLVTWFDWGEFVIWHFGPDLQVSMDGRRETVFSTEVQQAYRAFHEGQSDPRTYLDAIGAEYIWLPITRPVTQRLPRAGWVPLMQTDQSIVWARHNPANHPVRHLASVEPSTTACFPGL